MKFRDSDELCRLVRSRASRVVLRFSGGKDALAAWVQLRRYFAVEEISLVHQAFVPTASADRPLGFVERALRHYETTLETSVRRVVHPHFYALLTAGFAQPAERVERVNGWLSRTTLRFDAPERVFGLADDSGSTYIAAGYRATDSEARARSFKLFGPLNPERRTFAPIFDWSDDDVLMALMGSRLRLSREYRWWKYSFTTSLKHGFHPTLLADIARLYPDDFAHLTFWFPRLSGAKTMIDLRLPGMVTDTMEPGSLTPVCVDDLPLAAGRSLAS